MSGLPTELSNRAHLSATKLLDSMPTITVDGKKVVPLDFDCLKIVVQNSMVDGMKLFRERLVEAGVLLDM